MSVLDIFGVANKVMSLFNFDRKALRRNKIKKIEKEIDAILKGAVSDKQSRRLVALRHKLSALRQAAQNE